MYIYIDIYIYIYIPGSAKQKKPPHLPPLLCNVGSKIAWQRRRALQQALGGQTCLTNPTERFGRLFVQAKKNVPGENCLPPLIQFCFGVGGVAQISFVRHASSATKSWTQLCRGGGGGKGAGILVALSGIYIYTYILAAYW